MSQGRLIVFEGGEGVGKSTQLARLEARLTAAGVACVAFREPGGTPLGDTIRQLVLLEPERDISPRAEALLFMASRAELLRLRVQPALAEGKTVLLDRFFLSTYAYQIGGRELAEESVRQANALATGGLIPDLTVLLTLDATQGLERATARGAADRIERMGHAFHARVEAAFRSFAHEDWQRAHPECGPIAAVDASGSEEQIAGRVAQTVASRLPALAPALGVAA